MDYTVAAVSMSDRRLQSAVDALLFQEGIRRDGHIDYVCGVFDEDGLLCATGSCYANTLRCLAVSSAHRGEGLMNLVVSHLCEVQAARGNSHIFLYTKPGYAGIFSTLGFYKVAAVPGKLIFMENRRSGFDKWLSSLQRPSSPCKKISSVVMNAAPFTLGHRFLLEKACEASDAVHLFILSEESGPIPSEDRFQMVRCGVADLDKVILHKSGPYIISSATFPEYFLDGPDEVSSVHAELDIAVFSKISAVLGISERFVGEEPFSHVTEIYNRVMREKLPASGIVCNVIPRFAPEGKIISAGQVRQLIHADEFDAAYSMLPPSTAAYLSSPAGSKIIAAIQACADPVHH